MKTTKNGAEQWDTRIVEGVEGTVGQTADEHGHLLALPDHRAFHLDEIAWDDFIELADRPARSVPELARLLSSTSVFDD